MGKLFSTETLWKLPVFGHLRRSGFLNTLFRAGHGHYWGRFATRQDAMHFLPPQRRVIYDDDQLISYNIESFFTVHLFDWPLLFFLQKHINDNSLHVVTDFGGHVGVKYVAYRNLLSFPSDLRWQVIDVPAMVREGRRRLTSDDMNALRFFEQPEETDGCDVLICSGVLQYAEMAIEDLINRLPKRPSVILLNKVAVSPKDGFYTLEDYGHRRMPYRICGQNELREARLKLGYDLLADWPIPYWDTVVHWANGKENISMVGEAWQIKVPS